MNANNRFGILHLRSKEDVENDNKKVMDHDQMEGTHYKNESKSSNRSDSQS
jgi:hypothetical protein